MTKREDQARDYAAEQGWSYVKFYGMRGDSNTFGLTPREREVLTKVRDIYDAEDDSECGRVAEVISQLLERTK